MVSMTPTNVSSNSDGSPIGFSRPTPALSAQNEFGSLVIQALVRVLLDVGEDQAEVDVVGQEADRSGAQVGLVEDRVGTRC